MSVLKKLYHAVYDFVFFTNFEVETGAFTHMRRSTAKQILANRQK